MASVPEKDLQSLIAATDELSREVSAIRFDAPVFCVYNPLEYARIPYLEYLRRYALGKKNVIFLGMNPGPFGMAQTGVPFGEVAAVRDFLGIEAKVEHPACEHPKRPVLGFQCPRSEVSGRRLWGYFAREFGSADRFFSERFVANYCPLVFMDEGGANVTPDKLRPESKIELFEKCDKYLLCIAEIMRPRWVIGIGKFAAERASTALRGKNIQIGDILHPSPANPKANKDWDGEVSRTLKAFELF